MLFFRVKKSIRLGFIGIVFILGSINIRRV